MDDPPWLDNTFLSKVLQSVENTKGEVEIVRWQCEPAVPPGSNYLSLLYRIGADYKKACDKELCSIKLIVKTPLESGHVKEFVEFVNGYGKELQMYHEALPQMYELGRWRVTARSFDCPLDNSLVLEDLQVQGYKMADRIKQLDLPHCRQFLISLSRFHGLSAALHHRNSNLIESVGKQPLFSQEREKQEMYMKFNLNALLLTVKQLEGCERFIDMIHSRIDQYYDIMTKVFNHSAVVNVLNHGDTWTNNILFKYNDSGEVIDAKLVDFQMCQYGSFAHDIIYFWWTSANKEVREHHREELFEIYRHNLNETLGELRYNKMLSKEEFDHEIKVYAPFSVDMICTLLTVAMADPDNLGNFDEYSDDIFEKPVDENSPQVQNFRSKYYKAVLPTILRQVEEFGAFT